MSWSYCRPYGLLPGGPDPSYSSLRSGLRPDPPMARFARVPPMVRFVRALICLLGSSIVRSTRIVQIGLFIALWWVDLSHGEKSDRSNSAALPARTPSLLRRGVSLLRMVQTPWTKAESLQVRMAPHEKKQPVLLRPINCIKFQNQLILNSVVKFPDCRTIFFVSLITI